MDLASVVAALASVGVRVSGSTPNNNIQEDSSRACPTGLAGPEPSGTHNDPGQHFQRASLKNIPPLGTWCTHRCLKVMLAVMSWRHCQRLHQGTLSMKLQMPIVLHRRRKLLCHGVHSPH